MASLYEINRMIEACFDEDGELLDEAALDALQLEKAEKLENIALWIKNLDADAAAYDHEMKAFKARKEAAQNRAEALRKWLQTSLGGDNMVTSRVSVTFRRSERVDVLNAATLPQEYIITKTETMPDKLLIKKALKSGKTVDGAILVVCSNMTVK